MDYARLVRVKVHAGANKDRLEPKGPDAAEVWVKAPPMEGRANAAVLALAAAWLGARPGKLRIVKGHHSPSKIIGVLP